MHPPPSSLLGRPSPPLPTPAQPDLGVLVGLHVSLPNPADQGCVVWVLSVGLVVDLEGLLGLVGKGSAVSLFPLTGEVSFFGGGALGEVMRPSLTS